MKSDAMLDCIGLYCPMPIHQIANNLRKLEPGQVLEVVASDEGIKEDAPAWCRATGNEFVGMEEKDSQIKVYIKKTK